MTTDSQPSDAAHANTLPHVVIVGAGFGGLFATQALDGLPMRITLIDRTNHHVFQPLLYQVATAALAPTDVAWPIRAILDRQRNVTVLLDEVSGVDAAAKQVVLGERRLDYDYLVCATGVRDSWLGNDEWSHHAYGLKRIEDATAIRHRILMAFEQAEQETDPLKRERLMRFVVIGGGPTGVELAGAVIELTRESLRNDFRHIDPASAQVVLLEAGDRLLPSFAESSSRYAAEALRKKGVDVRLNAPVSECDEYGVIAGDERLASATLLFAAGVKASPVGDWLGAATDKTGRVQVKADLSVAGLPDVFVIGDTAAVLDDEGEPVPGIAPAAKQQGRYVAGVLADRIAGRPSPDAFRYDHQGNLATIGRSAAVTELPSMTLTGLPAWLLWCVAHLFFLIGMRSPLLIASRWAREYVTHRRGARLITDAPVERMRNDVATGRRP